MTRVYIPKVQQELPEPPELGERLLFVVWLAGKTLGAQNSKQFAEEIGKGAAQLSKWIQGTQRPSWNSIKRVADAVAIDPVWLDDPMRDGAKEPSDFAEWITARRARKARSRSRARRA